MTLGCVAYGGGGGVCGVWYLWRGVHEAGRGGGLKKMELSKEMRVEGKGEEQEARVVIREASRSECKGRPTTRGR